MPHAISLITTLAAGFGLALIFGFISARLGLPALVGYLVAGIVIGPATPGFVANAEIASQLAEIGVMLLMFGVGLHFSIKDLMAVRKIALPGAIVQMLVANSIQAFSTLSHLLAGHLIWAKHGNTCIPRPAPIIGQTFLLHIFYDFIDVLTIYLIYSDAW